MNIGFLFHLYQPTTQDEAGFRKIASECYLPLIKLIKARKDFRLTLNIPLSLLEQMDKFGYQQWLADVKELVDTQHVELTGTAAYHPLLTKIPKEYAEFQIFLQEYGLGYYFGRRSGFEGESAILIKDLNGFFPPELAVNQDLLNILDQDGYKWVLVDEFAVSRELSPAKSMGGVYEVKDLSLKIVARNRYVSNLISFKRDSDIADILNSMNYYAQQNSNIIIALDGELFGHHYADGLYLLDNLLDVLIRKKANLTTISDIVKNYEQEGRLPQCNESSWGESDEDIALSNTYPLWDDKNNKIQKIQWELLAKLVSRYKINSGIALLDGFETFPVWKLDKLDKLSDVGIRESTKLNILASMCLQSDQFWWASNKPLPTGQVLFNKEMIERGLQAFKFFSEVFGDAEFEIFVSEKIGEVKNVLG